LSRVELFTDVAAKIGRAANDIELDVVAEQGVELEAQVPLQQHHER
jgi:hypothetical protein